MESGKSVDPLEEIAESNWPAKGGYAWVAADVRNQSSLFRWSRLLNSWLNCTPIIAKGVNRGIVSLERVSAIDRVCHGPRQSTTWLSLVSHLSISRLDAFSQSFKHFKDGYFKFVPFSVQGHGHQGVVGGDKEVMEVLMKFSDKLPTKGLVRVYNSVHLIIDIEGHMAQSEKKNLALFQALRKEMAAKAKTAGNTDVPNLQESLVEVYMHGGTKRKAELSARPDKGKDLKKDIDINLSEIIINSIDSMEPDHLLRTMVEFGSKALILSRRVGSLYHREVKEGSQEKVEELQGKVDKFAEETTAWKKERESWEEEKKRLGTWKVRCLDSEGLYHPRAHQRVPKEIAAGNLLSPGC
ncbi:hypothetical protein DEO72_LG7g1365 [Vigna unguiculata]|uniref:Uncharacterized protein n=1 Tax=Vigna unguiculata TaxID=3917 RepID=A0A4D6MIP9_VIGUN|nr:hypothetical protein DEO72_LG7g1365 [Vigna unguiculata]